MTKPPEPGGRHSIGFGLEYIGLLCLRRPNISICALLILTAISLVGASRIEFEDDIAATYESEHPAYLDLAALREELAVDDIFVFARSETALRAGELEGLRDLHLELELIEGVEAVLSLFSLTEIAAGGSFGEPIFPDILREQDLDRFLSKAHSHPLKMAQTISNDGRAMLMAVIPGVDATDREALRKLIGEIDEAVSRFRTDRVRINTLGQQKLRFDITDAIVRDQVIFNGGGAILALIAGLLILRDVRLAVLAFTPAGFAIVWTLGFAGLVGLPITVITNVVPVLVLVLAFADSLHLTFGFRRTRRSSSARNAIALQIREIGPACALTSLTTAAALLSLLLTGYQALDELALFGSAGVLIAFLSVVTVFPIVARLLDVQTAEKRQRRSGFELTVPDGIIRSVLAHPTLVSMFGTICLAGGLAATLTTTPNFTIYENIPHNSATRQASIEADQVFGGLFNAWIIVRDGQADPMTTSQGWLRLQQVHRAAEAAIGQGRVFSAVNVADAFGKTGPLTEDQLVDLPASLRSRIGGAEPGSARVTTLVPDPNFSSHNRLLFDRLESAALDAGAARVIGTPVLARHLGLDIIDKLNISILAAATLSILLIAAAFRSLRLVPAVAVANLIPVVLTGASLHLLADGYSTIPAGLAMTVAFGVAVDDTIHVLNRAQLEHRSGAATVDALAGAIRSVGHVLLTTTIVLMLGIGMTAFSSFETVRMFGLLMILVLLLALLSDLVFLPALLSKSGRWWTRG